MPVSKIGTRDLVESGSVVLGRADTTFEVVFSDLKLEFKITEEGSDASVRAVVDPENDKRLLLVMNNWPPNLGGTATLQIGKFQDRTLFLNMSGFRFGDSERKSRLLTYTLSIGDRVNGK